MLFKPYRRTDRHWLRYATFGIWRQGLIPANKDRIGRVLGEEIPRNLIDPDEIATEIGKAATELFENESLLLRLRDVAPAFFNAIRNGSPNSLRRTSKRRCVPDCGTI